MLGRLYEPTPPAAHPAQVEEPATQAVTDGLQDATIPAPAPSVQPALGEPSLPASAPFVFTGSSSEYFRIWIVNLALSVVTLGFYSPWAKVRRLEYFYGHTQLAGTSFGYHGAPLAILRGRLLAVVLLVIYGFLHQLGPWPSFLAVLGFGAIMPWMIHRSLRFRFHNSSYRGLRFRFGGSLAGAYRVFLLMPFAVMASLGILGPALHWSIKRYQFDNGEFGSAEFECDPPLGAFYRTHVVALMLGLPWVLLGFIVFAGAAAALVGQNPEAPEAQEVAGVLGLAFMLFMTLLVRLVTPYITASIQNVMWNHLRVGPHSFSSAVSPARFWAIAAGNLVGVVCTLGLFQPFAATRLYKYKLECLTMLPGESLDGILAGQDEDIGAGGEETTELFDLDFGF